MSRHSSTASHVSALKAAAHRDRPHLDVTPRQSNASSDHRSSRLDAISHLYTAPHRTTRRHVGALQDIPRRHLTPLRHTPPQCNTRRHGTATHVTTKPRHFTSRRQRTSAHRTALNISPRQLSTAHHPTPREGTTQHISASSLRQHGADGRPVSGIEIRGQAEHAAQDRRTRYRNFFPVIQPHVQELNRKLFQRHDAFQLLPHLLRGLRRNTVVFQGIKDLFVLLNDRFGRAQLWCVGPQPGFRFVRARRGTVLRRRRVLRHSHASLHTQTGDVNPTVRLTDPRRGD